MKPLLKIGVNRFKKGGTRTIGSGITVLKSLGFNHQMHPIQSQQTAVVNFGTFWSNIYIYTYILYTYNYRCFLDFLVFRIHSAAYCSTKAGNCLMRSRT